MKNSRLFKVFVSLFMVVGMLFSANVVRAEDPQIVLDKNTYFLEYGKGVNLTATIVPEMEGKSITWASSNEDVATVDQEGKVTANSNNLSGTATISATIEDSNQSAQCTVYVMPSAWSIGAGYIDYSSNEDGSSFSYIATSEYGYHFDKWEYYVANDTTDENKRTCENETLTVTNLIYSPHAEFSQIPVTGISFATNSINKNINEGSFEIDYTVSPNDAYRDVKWVSSEPTVASVNEDTGIITPLKEGTTAITATSVYNEGISATCSVTITNQTTSGFLVTFMSNNWGTKIVKQKTTVDEDGKQILRLSETDDAGLLDYVMVDDNKRKAEGWGYNSDNQPTVAYSMEKLKQGVEISENVKMYPVRSHTVTFYKEYKEGYKEAANVHATVTTTIDGHLVEDVTDPLKDGKTFLAWYWWGGDNNQTKQYCSNLSSQTFDWDAELFPEWQSASPTITVNPSTVSFGEVEEGYGRIEKQVVITNNSNNAVELEIRGYSDNFHINNFSGNLSLEANGSQTLTMDVELGLTAENATTPKQYSFRFPVINKTTGQAVSVLQGSITVKYNEDSHACSLIPQTSTDTRAMKITCTNDLISNWVSGESLSFEFKPSNTNARQEHLNITPERITEGTETYLYISEEKITAAGLLLNGSYKASMDVYGTDHQQKGQYPLNDGAYIPMNTGNIVKVVNPTIVAGDTYSDGIHIKINDADYLNAIYNNAKSDNHHSGDSSFTSYIRLSKEDGQGNWNSYPLGSQDVTRKFVDAPDLVNNEIIIPTVVIVDGMIEAGTYGYQLHVPGYRDIEVYCNTQDPAEKAKLLKIINGAINPGTVYFQQNEDYSVTVFAGTKPDGTSNFNDLKNNWIGFSWTTPKPGGGAGWDYYGEDAIIDEENKSITLPANSEPLQGLYYGMLANSTTVDNLKITIRGFSPTIAYNAAKRDSTVITIKNHYRYASNVKSYILGTKVLFKSTDKEFLEKIKKVQFTRVYPDPNHMSGGNFSLARMFPGFQEVKQSKTEPGVWELELKLNFNMIKHLCPDASQEYTVQIESEGYVPSSNPFSERFTAIEYVTQLESIKDQDNPSTQELDKMDNAALTDSQFAHVGFTGGVTGEDQTGVNVSGTIAGAITSEDMDSILNPATEKIAINTTITDYDPESDPEMKAYLNGHHLGEVKNAVDIKILKKYPDKSTEDIISELGIESALVFSNMPELEDGKEYIIVTKHNGKIKIIPVTYKNGQVIGYTKEYSSFVLTTRDKVDPAPSNNESSKSSSTMKKTDNVVTCEMAGYPVN